jgi:hypothetical protein
VIAPAGIPPLPPAGRPCAWRGLSFR